MNNLRFVEPKYAIPLVSAIMNFPKRSLLYVIVDPGYIKDNFELEQDYLYHIKFFGYREQCERQWMHFPGKIVKLVTSHE